MLFGKYSRKIKNRTDTWNPIKDESFRFDLIESYFKKKEQGSMFQTINDKTILDIDFHELFMFIDRTNSRIGQQYLYNKLLAINPENTPYSDLGSGVTGSSRTPHTSPVPNTFDMQEKLIDHFNRDKELRNKANSLLSKLNKPEAYYLVDLFMNEYVQKPRWYWVIPILSVLSFITLISTIFIPKMLFLLLPFILISFIIHYWNKRNIFVYIDSIPQLLILCNTVNELTKTRIPGISGNEIIRSSLKSVDSLKNRLSVFKLEAKTNGSEIAAFILLIIEYIKIFFLIEPQVVFNVLSRLDKKRKDIQILFEYIGEIDSAISIASLRATIPYWCKPTLTNEYKKLTTTDVYHPLITNAIPNTLDTEGKSILLTGSNMSGKTTFIRTIAINTLLAQTINTVFAHEFRLSPMRIFSAIRISDDLLNDKSYYMEEVDTIKKMIDESRSGHPNIFFLDEIFKGTNTVERIAAGKAVLSYLSAGNNIVFVSTHDIEIATLLAGSYNLYHFAEAVDDQTIHFDYKLKSGKLTTRNAIKILKINNYPTEITNEARDISVSLKSLSYPY